MKRWKEKNEIHVYVKQVKEGATTFWKKNYCKKGVSEIRRCCTFVIPINHISFSVLATSLHVTVMERYIPRMFVEGVVPTPLTLSTCKVSLRASPELLSRIRFSTTLYFVWACENPHKQEHWHLFLNEVRQLVNCLITQHLLRLSKGHQEGIILNEMTDTIVVTPFGRKIVFFIISSEKNNNFALS